MPEQHPIARYQTLIHLGSGTNPAVDTYTQLAEDVWLVDADDDTINQLQETYAETPNLYLRQESIAIEKQPATFYHYNLAWANGLKPIDEATQHLYPGLRCLKTTQQLTQPINELVTEALKAQGQNLLILDLGEQNEPLLQALEKSGQLTRFTTVILLPAHRSTETIKVPPSLHGPAQVPEGLQLPEHSQVLERHPLAQELQNTKAELKETAQLGDEKARQAKDLSKEKENLKQQLAERDQQLAERTQQRDEKAKQADDATKARDELKNQLTERDQQLAESSQQLAETKQQVAKCLKELDEKYKESEVINSKLKQGNERLFDEIENKITGLSEGVKKELDKKLANSTKQIESTLELQNYLNTGETPLSYHGWPISPDLALYLAESLITQEYDLVIEFGSGTSTVLLAKILMRKAMTRQEFSSQKGFMNHGFMSECRGGLEGSELLSGQGILKPITTFEHDKEYHKQTAAMLHRAGLEKIVNLVHAPLVDYKYQDESYLYYDCDRELINLSRGCEGRETRVLVLVDGPPGATCINARFPALPKLIEILGKAKLDIVMDDYVRQEEKNIVDLWKNILASKKISVSEKILNFEKGACVLNVN